MARPNASRLEIVRDSFLKGWGAFILIVLGILGTVFTGGYKIGEYVTAREYKDAINNLNIAHQSALSETKEKGREQALQEFKDQQEQTEKFYNLIKGGAKYEK